MTIGESPVKFLTKSRFKLALECPTKLFYAANPQKYANSSLDDEFMRSLAEGGFQVGELAKLMHPSGQEVHTIDHALAIQETRQLLGQDDVTVFEAAVYHENLFARIDIVRKSGNDVDLIEVKAKSFDSTNPLGLRSKSGKIDKDMLPYLQDVAFQRHVMSMNYPELRIRCYLMLVDKAKTCSGDDLNQKFRIHRDSNGRSRVDVAPGTTSSDIGDPILCCVDVDDIVDEILREPFEGYCVTGSMAELATLFADKYRANKKITGSIGAHCAKCEFKTSADTPDLLSGFHECWRDATGLTDQQIDEGTVLDIWNFRGKQKLMDMGVVRLRDVAIDDLKIKESEQGISHSQRQWMQVSGEWPGGGEFYLDRDLVRGAMQSWKFPLHFIDFETSRVAVPFFAGQPPYVNIAFQFSHHEMQADGSFAHKSQFLSTTPGIKPNYEFVRQLKKAIGDHGTVFMWYPHENTTLNAILVELENDPTPPEDADALKAAIWELTSLKEKDTLVRSGERVMVDLCHLASIAFFHPLTDGSSSIKKVLPAVMHASAFLKERYSQPVYGTDDGIPSLNFKNKVWWVETDGAVQNPYKLLEPVFNDMPAELVRKLESDEEMVIAQGGAATTAYARLQFEDLADEERKYIETALLRYCELDTLAMVMIYQAWNSWL